MAMMLPIFGPTGLFSTQYSVTFNSNDVGDDAYSYRMLIPNIQRGGGKIRVTFAAHPSLNTKFDRCSVGIRSANADTVATPVELKFSGTSGTTIPAGSTQISDLTDFSCARSNDLIVVFDFSSTLGNKIYSTVQATQNGVGVDGYRKSATASWNTAVVSGFQQLSTGPGIYQVNVQKVDIFGN